ncbi:hypothetical protein [Methanosphaerula subterraneus]|uniref:hypothetical protein n=1 Tax=Methanosphaerula subterraneus TaxID=3350244 RepID=UPI003F8705E3
MKLNPSIISKLALMICGDDLYSNIFPYRSSYLLTNFFNSVGLDYQHDGTTKRWWVEDVLKELNEIDNQDNFDYPSIEITKIISQLLDPLEYLGDKGDPEKAVESMNQILSYQNFFVDFSNTTKKYELHYQLENFISTAVESRKASKQITFVPKVFEIPDVDVDLNLVSVMMPFSSEFNLVYQTIYQSCKEVHFDCKRADNTWKNSEIIQDIFELIFTSSIIIADFSGRNPNVFYEVGIAHSLGKEVIPLVQNISDVPFDLQHHRVLQYLNNEQGRTEMMNNLKNRLSTLKDQIGQRSK